MPNSTTRRDFTDTTDKPFSVTLWGSNPDETDNDDCWTGASFPTLEEAILVYREVVMFPDHSRLADECGPRGAWEYVMIDGPDCHEVTQNPDRRACAWHQRELERDAGKWRREIALEAGMLHGTQAYNDEMGY